MGELGDVTKDDQQIVAALRAKLADRVGQQRFDLWFGGGTRLAPRDGRLIVEAPSRFIRDWLRTHFRADLEGVGRELLGERATVEYLVNEQFAHEATRPPKRPAQAPRATSANGSPASANGTGSAPAGNPARSAAAPAVALATSATTNFDDFVVGRGNKLAVTSAQLVAERPGSISPLVVYGGTGCGKTHLLRAVRAAALAHSRKLHAVYLTAEQFTTYFLEALGGKGLPSFRRKYRGVDLLMIDDVQFFSGKRATLVELLYTIDTLLQHGKQLVFAADRAPNEITGLGAELSARLSGGLVCKLEQPDYETRLGIVEVLCRRMGVEISQSVQSLVAAHASNHAREISGALNRLQATSLALGRPITLDLAEEALNELAAQTHRVVRLPDIQKAVCDVFGLEPDTLQSSRKAKSVSYPRMLAMFLARKHTRAALSEIGHFFGRRSHSTVVSANKKVAAWMSQRQPLALTDQTWDIEDALRRVEDQLKAG